MKLGLINSAWAQSGRETAWGIQKTKELGFDKPTHGLVSTRSLPITQV